MVRGYSVCCGGGGCGGGSHEMMMPVLMVIVGGGLDQRRVVRVNAGMVQMGHVCVGGGGGGEWQVQLWAVVVRVGVGVVRFAYVGESLRPCEQCLVNVAEEVCLFIKKNM
jgi:hypothetical protein